MKRRRKRRGNIYPRKDRPGYEGKVTIRTAQGKKRISVYGRTHREVEEKLAQVRVDVKTGAFVNPSQLTVADFLTRWLEDVARPAIRESTYALYSMVIRKHIAPRIGDARLQRLTLTDLQGLLTGLEQDGVNPPLRQVVFRVLHTALKHALAANLIARNPATAVTRPRVPRKDMQTLKPEQAREFLEAAKGDRYAALYALLIGTGLRLGEALGLGWADVDLARGMVMVRRQLQEVGGSKVDQRPGRLALDELKTARSRRKVDLPGFVIEALRQQEKMQTEEAKGRDDFNPHLLVFVDRDGGFVRKSNLRRRSFEPLLKKAGIPRLRLHDLRHTAATLMLLQGVHPKVVQERLGHANISMTLGTYSHYLPTMGREAADKVDDLLRPAPKKPKD